ncbi:MAG: type II CRISPR-associated endonuclease Cas1, partial [Bacteroidales bacterium]|nr:type II CRISPR-associated endonuclease Cas1 [Bacteroidales bacterium]
HKLLENNVALIVCDDRHMPVGMMLNLEGNSLQQERFEHQINASLPLKKQLWAQTVTAKIKNQAANLKKIGVNCDNMLYWADSVKSGDPDNYEARAAAYYWANIFPQIPGFKRFREGSFPNNLINYAYAILRAVTARSLVASGLLPTLGIHHHNRYNAYCLADDIMEPYRPLVDRVVIRTIDYWSTTDELNTAMKRELLTVPAIDVVMQNEKSPLMVAMQQTTASLARCFMGEAKKILYPTPADG